MATEVVSTIRSSGGDYSSLSAWEAGEQRDLVSADEIAVAECYNDWPSGLTDTVTIDGFTTDSTRYVHIRAASGQSHDGTPKTGFWWGTATSFAYGLNIVEHTRLTGVEIHSKISTAMASIRANAANSLQIRNCVFGHETTTNRDCAELNAGGQPALIAANLFLGGLRCVNLNRGSGTEFKFYNNTVRTAGQYGVYKDNFCTAVAQNNVASGASVGDFAILAGSWGAGSDYNASGDTTAQTQFGATNSINGVVDADFVDAANDDFHLASGSGLIGQGANLYSDFTTDIDGDTWPSSGAWDIGFDYFTGGGGAVYDETFSASASSAFTLSDSWALNYAETFGASAASGATFTDTYDTPSVNYDETFAASAASGTELTDAWSLDYSETFSATAASGATLTDAWLLNYAETFAAGSTAAFTLADDWSLDYAETFAASATSGCDMAHSYAVGNDYVETFAASSVSVVTLTHAYSVQYAETFAATALADCSLVAAWALDYAETFAAATASGAVFTEAYETPAPGVFDETFAASSVSACDLTHAFSTPAAIGRVINPTLAASGVPARTLKGLKLIN